MPGAPTECLPVLANESLLPEEASKLQNYLQRQLEEDIARIFDESIYPDLEIVCGKLKIQTHSCILQARTNLFYNKLKTLLNFNIDKEVYDEVYSFISDAYTECNIKKQEEQILKYLQNHSNLPQDLGCSPIESSLDLFGNGSSRQNICFILKENDLFSLKKADLNCLGDEILRKKIHNKYSSQQISVPLKFRSEIKNSQNFCNYIQLDEQDSWTNQIDSSTFSKKQVFEKLNKNRIFDSVISSDSLLTEEPSSLSENCSGIYTHTLSFDSVSQLNEQYHSAMENNISLSDSGLESNCFLESNISASSHKDDTLKDTILERITSCSTVLDEATYSACPSLADTNQHDTARSFPANHLDTSDAENVQKPANNNTKETSYKSSKDEKQRQNEEIVILESSSISSETGSWESVFPSKLMEKNKQENLSNAIAEKHKNDEEKCIVPTTSCFIDAASLVEPEYEEQMSGMLPTETQKPDVLKLSQPIPCFSAKDEVSPSDWSETIDNDDSLEQGDKNDSDHKNLSPTIFEMTPISEDIPPTKVFENVPNQENCAKYISATNNTNSEVTFSCNTSNTEVRDPVRSQFIQTKLFASEPPSLKIMRRYNESSPIVSGGASVEDHLPQIRHQTESPLARRKTHNISNEYLSEDARSSEQSNSPAWVVDMSTTEIDKNDNLESSSVKSHKKDEKTECHKNCFESENNDKCSQKFFIDLKSLPDSVLNTKAADVESSSEKKNIFSMYIDFGNTPPAKEMPARLSSSLGVKKNLKDSKITKPKVKILHSTDTNHQAINENPITVDNSFVFEEYETLCSNPDMSTPEILHLVTNANKEKQLEQNKICNINDNTITKQTDDLFVKLSDLDKPIPKPVEISVPCCEKTQSRMTRSIPDNDWEDQVSTEMPRSIEVMSSFHSENALSLNRLFPHLKNELSRSMPGSLSGKTHFLMRAVAASSLDVNEQTHDASELSSVQSSICRSAVESCSTEESSQMSSLIGNCQSKLGQDLLRMFLEEIAPDVIVEVSGRRIKAHKCILSSRCQYFAGILSGGWVESAGNVIVLPPFSFNVVQFALCHIYSGVSTIPESISIVELATLADMLGLEGLKEAIMLTLKAKYCHFFHKPCSVCIAGVLECFPLSSVYGLDDLYHKCMRWITKYFAKVWPTKAFATLPKELLDKCYQQHVVNLSCENLVDTVYGCGIIVASLQKNRWAEIVARLCRRLVNAAAHFTATRLLEVLRIIATLPAEAPPLAKQALDDCVAAAIEWAPPEQLCRSYAFLSGLVKDLRSQNYSKPDLIANGNSNKIPYHNCLMFTHASSWRLQCEGALVRSAPRSVGTQAFKDLPPDLRKRLRDLGCIMYGPQTSLTTGSIQDKKNQSPYRQNNKSNAAPPSRNIDLKLMRSSFVPYAAKPVKAQIDSVAVLEINSINNKRLSMKNAPKIRTTKAQEQRARFNLSKNTQSHNRSSNQSSRPTSLVNTKCSSATSKTSKESDKKLSATNKIISKMVSSSESSRNSSPIQIRSLRSSRLKTHQSGGDRAYTMSQDSLILSRPQTAEPSSDSPNEVRNGNPYATYTKSKCGSASNNEYAKKSPKVQHQQKSPKVVNSNRSKTRIPVYLRQKTTSNADKTSKVSQKQIQVRAENSGTQLTHKAASAGKSCKTSERRAPGSGSLMNATKSSSAKIVSHAINDQYKYKNSTGQAKTTSNIVLGNGDENAEPSDIAIMERSGTFLKDEPTFGDKITNLDIDK